MKKNALVMLVLLTIVTLPASAQMAKFKALFLFNFAQNIGWPDASGGGDFIITVIGEDEVTDELKELSKTRKVGASNLIVKSASGIEAAGESHIIYLAQNRSNLMPILASHKKNMPVLLVANQQGLCRQGAGISFVTVDGKLRFEICPNNIESHGLVCSRNLVNLGIVSN